MKNLRGAVSLPMRKYFALMLLVALTTLAPSYAQTRLTVDTPVNGSTLNGPVVLTGRATPGSTVEVTGSMRGSTRVGNNGRWSIALDPGAYSNRNVRLTVRARGPWGVSQPTHLTYAMVGNNYAYNDRYYNNYYNRTVQDSLTDPYYDYPNNYNSSNYYVTTPYDTGRSLQLSVNSPTNGSSFRGNFTLAGTGTPGAEVIVTGSLSGRTVVGSNGYWSMPLSLSGLAPGQVVNLTAFARDRFGNQSNATELKYAVSW